MLWKSPKPRADVQTHGAERGLDRFEGFSDAVFAIALDAADRRDQGPGISRGSARRIRALQVDGGSVFAAEFEQACQQRGLHLFVLPPRSLKLNGAVEIATSLTPRSYIRLQLARWK